MPYLTQILDWALSLLILGALPLLFGLLIIVDWEVQRIRDIKRARRHNAEIPRRG